MKVLKLESTAPFQGLPELVAYEEGLFADEGLQIEWVERETKKPGSSAPVTDVKGANPFASHGSLLEQGKADMYNACEWGNYCRVQDTSVGSRQIGRRAIVTYTAIVVRPGSAIYTPQQLADVTVGVPFYFGSHYAAIQMLEGFLPRANIRLQNAPNASQHRYEQLMRGDVEATTLTEPYVTLAEQNGCRVICSVFYHGTEVASNKVDGDTYAAFNRAVRKAVARVNANKSAYMHYFIDYHKAKDPSVLELKADDLPIGRLVVTDPAPIPHEELNRTYEWLKGWGMLETTETAADLIDMKIQIQAHVAAE